jgi:predicted secreted hydrolase
MPEYVTYLLRGLVIGLAIAAPVGPIGLLCIRRTLAQGWAMGLISGLGAATADAVYGSLAAFGLIAISSVLIEQQIWLRLAGGLFLVFLGVRTFTAKASREGGEAPSNSSWNLLTAYTTTLLLTLSNPMTILSFVAIFAGLGIVEQQANPELGAAMVLGVFCGSAGWWLFLSGVFTRLRSSLSGGIQAWIQRVSGLILVGFGIAAFAALVTGSEGAIQSTLETNRSAGIPPVDPAGFTRATPEKTLTFPGDYGPHPDYQTEWWYFTGNLADSAGRRFGYQLTFFRRALQAPEARSPRQSSWSVEQVYLAHFALTDASAGKHDSFERLTRGAAGLAGAQAQPFEVWLEDWTVREVEPDVFELEAAAVREDGEALRLELQLKDQKGPILQGLQGYSQKGPDPGNASYYYSRTRMLTSGQIRSGAQAVTVRGYSWMDHEFSTSALAPDQVGWDWFSIQLDDYTELMVFQIRKQDGSIDSFSSGAWIDRDGSVTLLQKDDFLIQVEDFWQSPSSGGDYPSRWKIRVPGLDLTLDLTPLVPDQEMDLTYRYWEGAVQIQGLREGEPVSGYGYVEMTGYAGSMMGEF